MSDRNSAFLDRFTVVLFDLHGTLMLGQDRFGPEQDYYSTYLAIGGTRLDRESVTTNMHECLAGIMRDYDDPHRFENFPTLREAFKTYSGTADEDVDDLERVFAEHERGRLPTSHVEFVRRVAQTHELGIVSNILAPPRTWIDAFNRADVGHLFRSMVFSSEGRTIKPSLKLFERALANFPGTHSVLFVGDSLERDIRPARHLGLGTAWINAGVAHDDAADLIIPTLLALESTEDPSRS